MPKCKDLTGQVFKRLTVLQCVGRNQSNGEALWLCRCVCENETVVRRTNLLAGTTKSCGCLNRQLMAARNADKNGHNTKRGASSTWLSWWGLIRRCMDSKHRSWPRYGGANPPVKVCDRWLGKHGFQNFLTDMGERPDGTTLGRFGDVGDYKPENCAWQTISEQALERKKHYAQQPTGKKYQKVNQPIAVLAA